MPKCRNTDKFEARNSKFQVQKIEIFQNSRAESKSEFRPALVRISPFVRFFSEAAATAVPAKTIAHMFHFPGDQLPIVVDDHSRPAQLEPDEVTTMWSSSGEQHRGRQQKQQQQMPMYTIVPADPNNFLMGPREEEARNGMRTTTTSSSNRPMDVRTAWRSGSELGEDQKKK